MSLPGFSERKIKRQFDWLPYTAYKGRKKTWFLLLWVLYRKICRGGWFGFVHYA